jgi:hypothetical protein
MFKLAVWIRKLAWPTNEMRQSSEATRAGGVSE